MMKRGANSRPSKQDLHRVLKAPSIVCLRISAVLVISLLLAGSAANSLPYVYADNSAGRNTTAAHMLGAGIMVTVGNATAHPVKVSHNTTAAHMLGAGIMVTVGNATAHPVKAGEKQGNKAVFDSVTKTFNHSVRQAQQNATVALKQAMHTLQTTIKLAKEAIQKSTFIGVNTTASSSNATSAKISGQGLVDINKAYRKSLDDARADYNAAVKKANHDASYAIKQLHEQMKDAAVNKTDVSSMINARAAFWKEYFNIMTHQIKAISDARETLHLTSADALLSKFKALDSDTPAIDSAIQDYKNAVTIAIQKFEGSVDAANEHAKSEIDIKFSQITK